MYLPHISCRHSSVRHPLQPGIKVASKVLLPELNQMFSQIVAQYNERHDTQYDALAEYVPFKLSSDVSQLSNQPIKIREDEISVKPVLEIIKWGKGESLTIYSDKQIHLGGINVDLDLQTLGHVFEVEILQGKSWKTVMLSKEEYNSLFKLSDEFKELLVNAVRITNISGQEISVKLKTFRISFKE